jgi:hypothetical protein
MSIDQKIKYSKRSPNLLSMLNQKIQMNQRNSYNDDMLAINQKRLDNRRKGLAIMNRSDVSLPQSNLEIITSYRITMLFNEFDEAIDIFLNSVNSNIATGLAVKRKEEVNIVAAYNRLVTYIKSFARSYNISTDDKLSIITQFDRFIPKMKIVVNRSNMVNLKSDVYISILRNIEDKIFDNVYILDDGGLPIIPLTTPSTTTTSMPASSSAIPVIATLSPAKKSRAPIASSSTIAL